MLMGAPGGCTGVAVVQDMMTSVEGGALQGKGVQARKAGHLQMSGSWCKLLAQHRGQTPAWLDPGAQTIFLGCCVGVGAALEQAVSTKGRVGPPAVLSFIPPASRAWRGDGTTATVFTT